MKYDSKFEEMLHSNLLSNWSYHPRTFEFSILRKYTPDYGFILDDKHYYIESKGYFYKSEDCRLYTEFRNNLAANEELIFCYQDPNVKIKWKQKRKDGTRMTVSQWADSNKFRWYTKDTLFILLHEIKLLGKNKDVQKN